MISTIYNNYNLDEQFDDIRFCMIEDGENPTDDEVWDEIHFQDSINWEEECERLKEFFSTSPLWILQGTVGRWDGPKKGGFLFSDWKDLVKHNPTKDCDFIHWYDENGHLFLKCSHHDGDNLFEIKKVTKKGAQMVEKWKDDFNDCRSEKQIHDTIMGNNFFSALPHFAKAVYGC